MTETRNRAITASKFHRDHLHLAAYRRERRVRVLDNGLWLCAAGLIAAALVTNIAGFALAAAALVAVALCWRFFTWLHRGSPLARELTARRAEYVAYRARQDANDTGCAARLTARRAEFVAHRARRDANDAGYTRDAPEDDEGARLCDRLDAIEVDLPWWYRTS